MVETVVVLSVNSLIVQFFSYYIVVSFLECELLESSIWFVVISVYARQADFSQ